MRVPARRPCGQRVVAPRRAHVLVPRARFRDVDAAIAQETDYYALLDVTRSASDEQIKKQYRAMQRKYHPDIAGEQSRELSSKINVAYDVLTNKQARRQYDSMYREHGFSTTSLNSVEGLTGPLRERAVPIDELTMEASRDVAVDWLQQWGTTIAFGCEVPFPAPLQCDPVPDGVRIGVISASGGSVSLVGELFLEVDDDRLEAESVVAVAVTRVSKTPDTALPGERAVLKTLKNALKTKRSARAGVQVGGFWATAMAGALGFLPLINLGDEDTTYEAYRIPQRCSLGSKPAQK